MDVDTQVIIIIIINLLLHSRFFLPGHGRSAGTQLLWHTMLKKVCIDVLWTPLLGDIYAEYLYDD